MSNAKLAPAAAPLSRAERTIIENDVAKLAYFRNVGDYRKTLYLKALANHTVRLYAEVLRLEAERDALGAELEKRDNPVVLSTPAEAIAETPAPMCQDPVPNERREA